MTPRKINLVYFSATGTTRRIVAAVAEGMALEVQETYKLLDALDPSVAVPCDEPTIFGVPVFSGRVPETARRGLAKIKGDNTPAILVCVYGNRAFDDALTELADIVQANGFVPVSAAAFVAQHSIFPKVAQGRPDAEDLRLAAEFGRRSCEALTAEAPIASQLPGNRPYREYKKPPLRPTTDRNCTRCGACARECPERAIDPNDLRHTDKERCTACAHCIAICPQHARHFGGLLYRIAARKFGKACAERKEPYIACR